MVRDRFTSDTPGTGGDARVFGYAAAGKMPGWTVTTANLAWIGPSNPFGLTASDGSYFLDLSGYHDNQPYAGVAATSISTVFGQKV